MTNGTEATRSVEHVSEQNTGFMSEVSMVLTVIANAVIRYQS